MPDKGIDGVGILAIIIILFVLGVLLLIPFTIAGIIMIISSICVWIVNKKKKEQENQEEIQDKWDVAGKYKETLASGEKRKTFKTDDGVEIKIIIDDGDNENEYDDEDYEDDED